MAGSYLNYVTDNLKVSPIRLCAKINTDANLHSHILRLTDNLSHTKLVIWQTVIFNNNKIEQQLKSMASPTVAQLVRPSSRYTKAVDSGPSQGNQWN